MPPLPRLPFCVANFGKGSAPQLPLHRNPGLEIVYVSRGNLRWEVDGRSERVRPESVFYTFPWERHGSQDEYEPGHYWYWALFRLQRRGGDSPFDFSFHPSLGFSPGETAHIRRILTVEGKKRRSFPATRDMAWILPKLIEKCRGNEPLSRPVIESLSRLLVLELVRCVQLGREESRVLPGVETRMRSCIKIIRERAHEAWTLELMCRTAGLNRSQFATLLRKITGDTPTVYLRRMRILRAQELLRTTNQSITEIAMSSGFSTSQHFARIFRQFCGKTAQAYRKSVSL